MSNMKLWRPKGGAPIRIRDMSDEHLENTKAMLERWAAHNVAQGRRMGEAMLSTFNPDSVAYDILDSQLDHDCQEVTPDGNSAEDDFLQEHCPIYFDIHEEVQNRFYKKEYKALAK